MSRALLIGGTVNQHRMLAAVAAHLPETDCAHTSLYVGKDPLFQALLRLGVLRHSLGEETQGQVLCQLRAMGLKVDPRGAAGAYDIVILGTDLYVPTNLGGIPKVLVQELSLIHI